MAKEEAVLLERFVASGDAGAFSEIVRRYASLVYSACIRILGDSETAADATQETFFYLLKKADTITGSVPAWLHRVATSKSVDKIRAESIRRRAENKYADAKCREVEKWGDLSPYVDQALDALDAPSRELLIKYFFEGRTLTDIAADQGVSHPTVSRRIKTAVHGLRSELRKTGVAVSAVALGSLLTESTAQAAPPALLTELAKMALAGGGAGGSTAIGGLLLAAKAKIIIVAAVVGIGAVGVFTYRYFNGSSNSPDAVPVAKKSTDRPYGFLSPPPQDEPQVSEEPGVSDTPPEIQSPVSMPEQPLADASSAEEQPPEPPEYDTPPELDLSSPEATLTSFIKSFVAGDVESVLACCVVEGNMRADVQAVLLASPDSDDPQQRENYMLRMAAESLDTDAEMPVISTEETPNGVSVTWLVTFKREFSIPDHTFAPGDQFEVNARLVEYDGKWLVRNML